MRGVQVMRCWVLLGVICAGCAIRSPSADPAALQDAYLIAHGMAASYVERPDANPAKVQQLVLIDSRATAAMRAQDGAAVAAAVAALTARVGAP